jgi:hypothetical protein
MQHLKVAEKGDSTGAQSQRVAKEQTVSETDAFLKMIKTQYAVCGTLDMAAVEEGLSHTFRFPTPLSPCLTSDNSRCKIRYKVDNSRLRPQSICIR